MLIVQGVPLLDGINNGGWGKQTIL